MKYLGEETTREVVKQTVRKVEYIRCDKCEKKIIPAKYREEKNNYIRIHTWHNDWGNDSIDSHYRNDYCKDCAKEVIAEYISNAKGTEELEFEHKRFWGNETHNGYDKFEEGYCLSANDKHRP